jgi:hypothetical protein
MLQNLGGQYGYAKRGNTVPPEAEYEGFGDGGEWDWDCSMGEWE